MFLTMLQFIKSSGTLKTQTNKKNCKIHVLSQTIGISFLAYATFRVDGVGDQDPLKYSNSGICLLLGEGNGVSTWKLWLKAQI